jgi:hypothetical protein
MSLDRTDDASTAAEMQQDGHEVGGSSADATVAAFSRITSSVPAEVSKVFEMHAGKLTKTVSAHVSKGKVDVLVCRSLEEFAGVLTSLQRDQCLIYGVPPHAPVDLMTDAAWANAGRPSNGISRTEENFRWREGQAGVLMLDHDPQPGMPPYQPEELVDLLRRAVPAMAQVDMLTWPSASSLIFNGETDEVVSPLKGCRVYVMVSNAATIPAWGRHIVDVLWSAGHGVYTPSRAGRLLERGLFDTAVWQASRIDFAAGAICRAPLQQRRGHPLLHRGTQHVLGAHYGNEASGPPLLTEAQATAAAANKSLARAAKAGVAAVAAAKYAQERIAQFEEAAVKAGRPPAIARARATAAVQAMLREERPELHGDAIVRVLREDASFEDVTVGTILRRKAEFDGMKTLDPIEPEYDGYRVVGKLFLSGPVPTLFSFARGGSTYKLVAQVGTVEVVPGALDQGVDQTLACLRGAGDVYDHGDALATVSADGTLVAITKGLVQYTLSSRIGYNRNKYNHITGTNVRLQVDPPPAVCASVYELGEQRRLPRLNAVVTAPIIVGDRLLQSQGYDAESGLVVVLPGESRPIELGTGIEAVMTAFSRLQARFETFPLETPADRGVLLAALFTAVMRPGLRTAPGFAFDAPAQGTGKSLLADCVAIVGTGSAPSALPHLFDDESEVRKRVVSLLFAGVPVMIWDNIKGTFDSAVLASLMTAERFNDRLLGETRMLTLPNRMLALFNGNNMMLRGELTRRILTCRLDAGMERPYLRSFSASPRDVCINERQEIVRDVLTIIWGYQMYGRDFGSAISLGSFEEWSAAVLRPLLWAIEVCGDGRVADPLSKLQNSEDEDEDLSDLAALHRAWHDVFADEPKTVRQVMDAAFGDKDFHDLDRVEVEPPLQLLRKAIEDFVGSAHYRDRARELGKQLAYRRGRVVDGNRKFTKLTQRGSGGVAKWVASVGGSGSGK